jgi:sugar-specific transcriptional regulator TrmB
MSSKRIIKALKGLGLSQIDANVYVYLALMGPHKLKEICNTLNLKEKLLYQSLENLQNKGVVSSEVEQQTLFFALPFEQALDLLVKAQLKEAQNVKYNKSEIISKWKLFTEHS